MEEIQVGGTGVVDGAREGCKGDFGRKTRGKKKGWKTKTEMAGKVEEDLKQPQVKK